MYDIDTSGTRIDEIVKKNAMICVKQAMLKTIPSIHKKPYRTAFLKAFRIARKERLFLQSVNELLAGLKRKFSRKLFRAVVQN